LFFVALLCFAKLNAPARAWQRTYLGAILGMTLVAVVLQSQRTTWVTLPIAAICLYPMARRVRGAARAAPLAAIGVLMAVAFGGTVLANRLPLLTSGFNLYAGRLAAITVPLYSTLSSDIALLGAGTGTALGAARHVAQGPVSDQFESGWNIPMYMFGVPGLLALLAVYASMLRMMWRAIAILEPDRRWVPAGLFLYCTVTAVLNGSINYPPQNIYFWLSAGLVAALATGFPRREPSSTAPVLEQASAGLGADR
jgi:hypothetical protein